MSIEPESWVDAAGRRHFTPGGVLGIADLADGALARLMRTFRRAIEDGRSPEMHQRLLAIARTQQLARLRLRMRYGAVDNHVGTDSYDRFYRLGEAPTYRLAAAMDRTNAELGRRHVLAWPVADRAAQ